MQIPADVSWTFGGWWCRSRMYDVPPLLQRQTSDCQTATRVISAGKWRPHTEQATHQVSFK